MNQEQASRLLDIGFDFVARHDAAFARTIAWQRDGAWTVWLDWASAYAADRARCGVAGGGQLARQVAVDDLTGLLTVLVPVPGGGFLVAAVERAFVGAVANRLANELEAAVRREFGPKWAPWIAAAGVGAATLLAAAASRSS